MIVSEIPPIRFNVQTAPLNESVEAVLPEMCFIQSNACCVILNNPAIVSFKGKQKNINLIIKLISLVRLFL